MQITYRIFAGRKELRIRDRVTQVRANNVGPKSFGWFVGHLDAILKDRDWEIWTRVAG